MSLLDVCASDCFRGSVPGNQQQLSVMCSGRGVVSRFDLQGDAPAKIGPINVVTLPTPGGKGR
eukprot:2695399-Amphidinium_carterae.1